MKTLNNKTKKAISMINAYNYASDYNIYQAYKKPSYNKVKAWETCKKQCLENNGKNLKIIGHNSSYFSAGFTFEKDNKKYLFYITYANNFIIEL